jgi:hypothetical protein
MPPEYPGTLFKKRQVILSAPGWGSRFLKTRVIALYYPVIIDISMRV